MFEASAADLSRSTVKPFRRPVGLRRAIAMGGSRALSDLEAEFAKVHNVDVGGTKTGCWRDGRQKARAKSSAFERLLPSLAFRESECATYVDMVPFPAPFGEGQRTG